MARDWRKVALAVLAAATLASVCVLGSRVEAQQTAKSAKAPAKSSPPQAKKDDDDEEQGKAPAKKKRQDPVEAQRAIDAADKLLQGGKAEQAAQALTATLAGGNLPPAIMARALYMRGMAYRQQSKPAQAISDLTSALWLKGGLTAEDRQDCAEAARRRLRRCRPHRKRRDCRRRRASDEGSKGTACRQELGCRDDANGQFRFQHDADRRRRRQLVQELVQLCGACGASQQRTARDGVDRQDRGTTRQGRASACCPARCQRLVEQDAGQCRNGACRGSRAQRPARRAAEGKYRVQLATVRTQQEAAALAAKAKRALAGALAHGTGNRPGGTGQYGLFLPGAGRAVCDRAGDAGRVRQGQRHRFRLPDGDAVARLTARRSRLDCPAEPRFAPLSRSMPRPHLP